MKHENCSHFTFFAFTRNIQITSSNTSSSNYISYRPTQSCDTKRIVEVKEEVLSFLFIYADDEEAAFSFLYISIYDCIHYKRNNSDDARFFNIEFPVRQSYCNIAGNETSI